MNLEIFILKNCVIVVPRQLHGVSQMTTDSVSYRLCHFV